MTRTHTNITNLIPAELSGDMARFVTPVPGAMNADTHALAKGYVR